MGVHGSEASLYHVDMLDLEPIRSNGCEHVGHLALPGQGTNLARPGSVRFNQQVAGPGALFTRPRPVLVAQLVDRDHPRTANAVYVVLAPRAACDRVMCKNGQSRSVPRK